MDIQMPGMDGCEATEKLRAQGFKKPIVALTAHALGDELNRCLRAGCDLALTKPITKKALVERLSQILTPPN
jgi:CheY-like chemotaxis protein